MPRILVLMILGLVPLFAFAQEQSHIDAAKELLELTHSDQMVEKTYEQIMPYLQQMTGEKDADAERQKIIDGHFARSMEAMMEELNWEKMEPFMVDAYVSAYSEEELRELSQFYASPIGQKFVSKTPELTEASMRMAMQMMEKLRPRLKELQGEFREELKAYAAMKKAREDGTE